MKNINEPFTDEDFNKLKDKKGELTWKQFILTLLHKPTPIIVLIDPVKCPICDSEIDKEELGYALEDFTKRFPDTRQYFSRKTVN